MVIYLDENFRVRTDPYNHVLEELIEQVLCLSEECEELEGGCACELESLATWEFRGCYNQFNKLLHGYLHNSIMRESLEELEEILKAIEQVETVIENLPKVNEEIFKIKPKGIELC